MTTLALQKSGRNSPTHKKRQLDKREEVTNCFAKASRFMLSGCKIGYMPLENISTHFGIVAMLRNCPCDDISSYMFICASAEQPKNPSTKLIPWQGQWAEMSKP